MNLIQATEDSFGVFQGTHESTWNVEVFVNINDWHQPFCMAFGSKQTIIDCVPVPSPMVVLTKLEINHGGHSSI
eukprot:Skav202212  [mRNA]  locus=scaffold5327:75015:75236:+ [translate_table: standard]